MQFNSNTMAKISAVVPQGPHFAARPYWVTVDDAGEYSCQKLDPAGLILRIARVRAQMGSDTLQPETYSFHRAFPVRMEVLPLTVRGSQEGLINPSRAYYALMMDSLLFELHRLFKEVTGVYSGSQQVLAAVAYDHWGWEFGKNPTAAEHRELLTSSPEDLAALVAPSL